MTIRSSQLRSHFSVLLLLSLHMLLGSCRSERLAFEFQPTALGKRMGAGIVPPPGSTASAAVPLPSPVVITPYRALLRHQRRVGPLLSRHQRKEVPPATAPRVASIHWRPMTPRATRGSLVRHLPNSVARSYEGLFYTGLLSAGIGLLCLITSLFLLSGLLALVGLGALLLGLFLAVYGLYGDGHWKT